jgi:hypothetical protein
VVRTAAAHPRLSHAVLRDKAFFQFIDRPRRRKANTGLWTGRAARSMPEAQAKWWGTPCQKLFKNSLFKKFLGEPPIPWAEDPAADAKRRREAIPYYEILYVLNECMWREAIAQAKKELWAREPWMRQWPELFR